MSCENRIFVRPSVDACGSIEICLYLFEPLLEKDYARGVRKKY